MQQENGLGRGIVLLEFEKTLPNASPKSMINRNAQCPCGNQQKFKHCCGAISPNQLRPSNEELEAFAIKADDDGLTAGEEPRQRAFSNILRILKYLKIDNVALTGVDVPSIVTRIHQANDRLFRPKDKQEGGIHLGFFMFRDIFCRLYVPIMFGSPQVDFVKLLDLSDDQKRWMSTDHEAMARFDDQAFDLFDFGYGFMEFGYTRAVNDQAKELIYRAHVHLESAAATATSAFDFRGTLQSSLLATELALKAALAGNGVSDAILRNDIGHNLSKAVAALKEVEPNFDVERVGRAISSFPNFVISRYEGKQPDRRETGDILMKAQYIASEVTRAFTTRNIRKDLPLTTSRTYPY